MTDARPRASNLKVVLAVVAMPVLTFYGCSLVADGGRNYSGRGLWEFNALAAFVAAAALAVYCYRLAFKAGPSFAIHEDRLEHHSWKQPIYFRNIAEVVVEPASFWRKRAATVHLQMQDGSIQYVPTFLMTHGPEAFAEQIERAIEAYRKGLPSLS